MKHILNRYKKDILIIMGIIIFAIIANLLIHLYYGNDGGIVRVYVDGGLIAEYDISKNQCHRISVEDDYNEILIENGEVRVRSSSCENQICVNHLPISKNGESIICLPHRLVVRIDDNNGTSNNSGLDGVAE